MSTLAVNGGAAEEQSFGTLPDGSPARLFSVRAGDVVATFTDFGARLVSVTAPDRDGRVEHVVLGYGSAALYHADKMFLGATIGRYGNRIAGGRFTLAGERYQVPVNDAPNALHGGPLGFDRRLWQASPIDAGVEFSLESADGDMGFPGNLKVRVRFTLEAVPAGASLVIDYFAETDRETVVNLTNHAYFNLAGEPLATDRVPAPAHPPLSILGHQITLPAEQYTPVDSTMIPTGELRPVAGTPFDLRKPVTIGDRVDLPDTQLQLAGGFDHNFVLGAPGLLKPAATLREPGSGRTLTVETSEPGVQFYSGNAMDGLMPDRRGGHYVRRAGLCLETQHYPDSPNQPAFPTTVLQPGETLRSSTVLTFGVEV